MGVVVFDSDVLIGFLNVADAQHTKAVAWMQDAVKPGTRRMLCAVNHSEILIGPLKVGQQELVQRMLVRFAIETIVVDTPLADRAAALRARTGLALPDAYALATAVHAEKRGYGDVRIASFDRRVLRAYAQLHPNGEANG